MKGTTAKTSRIFLYSIWSGFNYIPTSGILADGNREPQQRKHVFPEGTVFLLTVFVIKQIYPQNTLFQKTYYLCKLYMSTVVPNFSTLQGKPFLFKLVNFGISQLISDGSKKVSQLCPDKIRKIKKNEKQHFSKASYLLSLVHGFLY